MDRCGFGPQEEVFLVCGGLVRGGRRYQNKPWEVGLKKLEARLPTAPLGVEKGDRMS